jgi:1,4-dihydroxy-2-naphthoyl-CoA hydrolase
MLPRSRDRWHPADVLGPLAVSPPPPFTTDDLCTATTVLFSETRFVRFQDVDAATTIYFPRVLEYFADAYLGLLRQAGLDVPRLLRERVLAAPLKHAEADYLRPLFFGDEVAAQVVRARLGTTSVAFGHRLVRPDGTVSAVGHTVHVFVDGKSFKPIELPTELRAFIEQQSSK